MTKKILLINTRNLRFYTNNSNFPRRINHEVLLCQLCDLFIFLGVARGCGCRILLGTIRAGTTGAFPTASGWAWGAAAARRAATRRATTAPAAAAATTAVIRA